MNNLIESLKPYSDDCVIVENGGNCIVGSNGYNAYMEKEHSLPKIPKGYFYIGCGFKGLPCFRGDLGCLQDSSREWAFEYYFSGEQEDGHYLVESTDENIKLFASLVRKHFEATTEKKEKTMSIFEKAAEIQSAFTKVKKEGKTLALVSNFYGEGTHANGFTKEVNPDGIFDIGVEFNDSQNKNRLKFYCNKHKGSFWSYEFSEETVVKIVDARIETSFKINGYIGEYHERGGYWQFGCAKIHAGLLEGFWRFAKSPATIKTPSTAEFKYINAIKIGDGEFSVEQIEEMCEKQKIKK